ncbi:MAG: NAD(P)-dependent oxidoreductase [Roseburia sp.]|nr:hypothetical protein [Anaeroplasma bactoclasticum]MCM1196317.1 NAD(P)-dependent oxidoreductase [Roseburia sp.]
MKDWTGNINSVFKALGASNHCVEEREENDYYATSPEAIEKLLQHEQLEHTLWECACGEGHLSKALQAYGHHVDSTDLIYRGYGLGNINFLEQTAVYPGSIITNPPYRYVTEFILKALELVEEGHHVYMLLKLTALEGQERYNKVYSKYPPKKVYVFYKRISCAKNGKFGAYSSSAVAYAWYVWEKGYTGDTIIKWI